MNPAKAIRWRPPIFTEMNLSPDPLSHVLSRVFRHARPRGVAYYPFPIRPLGSALGELFNLAIVAHLAACWLAKQEFWTMLVC